MNFIKSPALFLFVFLFSIKGIHAQDHSYADAKLSAANVNPAFSGSIQGLEASTLQRIQWPHQDLNIYTHFTQFSYGGGKKKWWFSGSWQHVNQGGLIDLDNWTLRICKQFTPSKNFSYRFALEGTILFREIVDYSNFSFGDEIDPRAGFVYPTHDFPRGGTISNADFAAGTSIHLFGFTLGISAHHLTQPNFSLMVGNSPIKMRWGVQSSYDFPLQLKDGTTFHINPFFWWKSQSFNYWRAGISATRESLYASYALSSNQHIIGLGYAWKNCLSARYHFSLYASTFAKQLLAHEIGFEWMLRAKKNKTNLNEHLKGAF